MGRGKPRALNSKQKPGLNPRAAMVCGFFYATLLSHKQYEIKDGLMTKIVALNKEEHGNMRCKTNMGYHFAAKDAVMVLGLQELPKAALALPIGIIKQGDQYMTAALQGLQPQQNLLVNPEGKWRASYIPAAYRAYPFVLATEGERTILCMRDPDTYLSATEGRELFDGDEPSQGVRELIQ